jgi:hypothetical protein
MPEPTSRSPGGPADHRLTDRVLARIKDAHRSVRGRPGSGLGRRSRAGNTEVRALRHVFLELGQSYRSYRRRTGEPVSAEVRDAARRFRRELDLVSLVSVAATLERLDGDLVN